MKMSVKIKILKIRIFQISWYFYMLKLTDVTFIGKFKSYILMDFKFILFFGLSLNLTFSKRSKSHESFS